MENIYLDKIQHVKATSIEEFQQLSSEKAALESAMVMAERKIFALYERIDKPMGALAAERW